MLNYEDKLYQMLRRLRRSPLWLRSNGQLRTCLYHILRGCWTCKYREERGQWWA